MVFIQFDDLDVHDFILLFSTQTVVHVRLELELQASAGTVYSEPNGEPIEGHAVVLFQKPTSTADAFAVRQHHRLQQFAMDRLPWQETSSERHPRVQLLPVIVFVRIVVSVLADVIRVLTTAVVRPTNQLPADDDDYDDTIAGPSRFEADPQGPVSFQLQRA